MSYDPVPPFRRDFDAARDPYTARNALGIPETTGGGPPAPASAEYVTASADATLTNERVLTNTATITWDFTTPGQAKANAAGGGNVSNSGTPALGQYAKWVTATTIQGVAPATVLSDIGAQPAGSYQAQDATLTALAAYNTNGLLTQTAPDTFTGRTLTGPAAGITVSNGNGVAGNPTLALANDLAALEALGGTNTIYYRSGTDAWTAVTIGTGLSFSGGTLQATAGGGNVSNTGTPAANQLAVWTAATTIKGDANLTWSGTAFSVTGAIVQRQSAGDGFNFDSSAGQANIIAAGSSADIGLAITSKGNGAISLYNAGFGRLSAQFTSQPGSNTFVTFTGGTNQSYISNNPAGKPINIQGVTDGSAAPAGYVGECIEAQLAPWTAGPLTNNAAVALASIALTAGDWEVSAVVHFNAGGVATGFLYGQACISLTPNVNTSADSRGWSSCGLPAGAIGSAVIIPIRVSLTTSATYYINGTITMSVPGTGVYVGAALHARRVR